MGDVKHCARCACCLALLVIMRDSLRLYIVGKLSEGVEARLFFRVSKDVNDERACLFDFNLVLVFGFGHMIMVK